MRTIIGYAFACTILSIKVYLYMSLLAISSNRNFVEHDYETTNFSRFISSTFGNMSISQALDEIVCNSLQAH